MVSQIQYEKSLKSDKRGADLHDRGVWEYTGIWQDLELSACGGEDWFGLGVDDRSLNLWAYYYVCQLLVVCHFKLLSSIDSVDVIVTWIQLLEYTDEFGSCHSNCIQNSYVIPIAWIGRVF